jgi:hypothetical protein
MARLFAILVLCPALVGAATFQRPFEIGSPIGIAEVPGGFVVAAASGSTLTLLGLDGNGDQTWMTTGEFSGGAPAAMAPLSGGGLLIAGYRLEAGDTIACVVRAGSTGEWLLQADIPASGPARALGCVEASDGSYRICGATGDSDRYGFIAWMSADGTVLDMDLYETTWAEQKLVSIAELADGGFAACGDAGDHQQNWGLRVAADGTPVWSRIWQNGIHYSSATGCLPSDDCEVVLCGWASADIWSDMGFSERLNQAGDTVWEHNYQSSWYPGGELHAMSIDEIDTGGYCVTGSDGCTILIRTDEVGSQVWRAGYVGSAGLQVKYCSDGGFLIGARIWSGDSTWVIKTDGNGYVESTGFGDDGAGACAGIPSISVSPNPAFGPFRIAFSSGWSDVTLAIFDSSGRRVYETALPGAVSASEPYQIDTSTDLIPGLYSIRAESETVSSCSRLVVLGQ